MVRLGLGAAGLLHAAPPESGEDDCDDCEYDDRGRRGDPPPSSATGGERCHRSSESLFHFGETTRIALAPQPILPVCRSGPKSVIGAIVLVPGLGRLTELVSELNGVGILSLPTDEAWPVGEEGLVDDLDTTGGFVFVLSDLVGGEETGVDEFVEDISGGTGG